MCDGEKIERNFFRTSNLLRVPKVFTSTTDYLHAQEDNAVPLQITRGQQTADIREVFHIERELKSNSSSSRTGLRTPRQSRTLKSRNAVSIGGSIDFTMAIVSHHSETRWPQDNSINLNLPQHNRPNFATLLSWCASESFTSFERCNCTESNFRSISSRGGASF